MPGPDPLRPDAERNAALLRRRFGRISSRLDRPAAIRQAGRRAAIALVAVLAAAVVGGVALMASGNRPFPQADNVRSAPAAW